MQDNKNYACKKISKQYVISRGCKEDLDHEINNLKRADHPNIIKLTDYTQTESNYYIFTEYCNGGNLYQLVHSQGYLSEALARFIILKVIDGIKYLHSQNVIHRDIKSDNILLHFPQLNEHELLQQGKSEEYIQELITFYLRSFQFQVKIADLGFSKELNDASEEMQSIAGTPINMAPEIMNRRSYTMKADIWSIGVLLYNLMTGSFPFLSREPEDLIQKVETGIFRIRRDTNITPICLDLINRCLRYDPEKRINWEDVEKHPYYCDPYYYKQLQQLSISQEIDESLCNIRSNRQLQQQNQDHHEEFKQGEYKNDYHSEICMNCKDSFVMWIHQSGYLNGDQRAQQQEIKLRRQGYIFESSKYNQDLIDSEAKILNLRQIDEEIVHQILRESNNLECDLEDIQEGKINQSKFKDPLSNYRIMKEKGKVKKENEVHRQYQQEHDPDVLMMKLKSSSQSRMRQESQANSLYARTKNSTNVVPVSSATGTIMIQGTFFNSRPAFPLNNIKDTQEIKNFTDSTAQQHNQQWKASSIALRPELLNQSQLIDDNMIKEQSIIKKEELKETEYKISHALIRQEVNITTQLMKKESGLKLQIQKYKYDNLDAIHEDRDEEGKESNRKEDKRLQSPFFIKYQGRQ